MPCVMRPLDNPWVQCHDLLLCQDGTWMWHGVATTTESSQTWWLMLSTRMRCLMHGDEGSQLKYGSRYLAQGCNALCVEMRGHGCNSMNSFYTKRGLGHGMMP